MSISDRQSWNKPQWHWKKHRIDNRRVILVMCRLWCVKMHRDVRSNSMHSSVNTNSGVRWENASRQYWSMYVLSIWRKSLSRLILIKMLLNIVRFYYGCLFDSFFPKILVREAANRVRGQQYVRQLEREVRWNVVRRDFRGLWFLSQHKPPKSSRALWYRHKQKDPTHLQELQFCVESKKKKKRRIIVTSKFCQDDCREYVNTKRDVRKLYPRK